MRLIYFMHKREHLHKQVDDADVVVKSSVLSLSHILFVLLNESY